MEYPSCENVEKNVLTEASRHSCTTHNSTRRPSRCHYGSDDVIVDAVYESVRKLPTWTENDSAGMLEFSDELNGILGTMSACSLANAVPSPMFFKQNDKIMEKMPYAMRSKFMEHCWASQLKNVEVPDRASWLDLQLSFVETQPDQHTFPKARQSEKQKTNRPRIYTTMAPCESDEAVVAHT